MWSAGIRVPGIISWPNGLKEAGVMPGAISGEPIIGSDVGKITYTFFQCAFAPEWQTAYAFKEAGENDVFITPYGNKSIKTCQLVG